MWLFIVEKLLCSFSPLPQTNVNLMAETIDGDKISGRVD
jgi:hypothetical protein